MIECAHSAKKYKMKASIPIMVEIDAKMIPIVAQEFASVLLPNFFIVIQFTIRPITGTRQEIMQNTPRVVPCWILPLSIQG